MEIVPGSNPTVEAEVDMTNALLASLSGFQGGSSIAQPLYTHDSVPEPACLALLGMGLVAAAAVRRERRPQAAG
jgi:hypothetical protein